MRCLQEPSLKAMKTLFFFLMLLAINAGAASTYYVDYGSGSDANNGTATGTPWKHVPGDPSATGNPAAASGVTGTIYLKGGVHYNLATAAGITIDNSHYSRSGPLTIVSGASAGWGSGMAIIDGAGVGQWIFAIDTMTNVTLRSLNMGDCLYNSGEPSAVSLTTTFSNIVDSCIVHDIGTNNSNAHQDGIGLDGGGSCNTITNCLIYNITQKAIEPYRCGTNIIANNIIHHCRDHGIVVDGYANRIFGNVISNACANVWLATANAPGYCIKIDNGLTSGPSNGNMIYNNIFAHNSPNGGGISIDNLEGGTTGVVDNNLIANNTFIDITAGQEAGMRFDNQGAGAVINGTVFVNNIVCSEQSAGNDNGRLEPAAIAAPYSPASSAGLGNNNLIAYNLFFGQNSAIHPYLYVGGAFHSPTWANFADGGSTSPDYRFKVPANGSGNSFIYQNQFFDVNPLFTSYPNDLTLQAGSPARNAGTNLSAFFTTDFRGQTRVSWSIGAFDMPTDPFFTQQPSDQSAVAGASATFTAAGSGFSTLSWQWKWNGTNVTGAVASTWITPILGVGDNNSPVQVILSDTAGTVLSRVATLFVANGGQPPAITVPPQSITIVTNQNATFTVQAAGSPTLTYQWALNGVNIAGATTTSFTTNSVPIGANGNSYTVGITNSFGGVLSSPAILTVTLPSPGVTTLKIGTGKVGTLHLPGP